MTGLEQWIGRLLAIAVVGWLLEMIVPASSMRGYVRLVVGLALMVAVVSPLVELLGRPGALQFAVPGPGGADASGRAGQRLVQRDRAWVWTTVRSGVELSAREAALAIPGVSAAQVSARIDERVSTPGYGVPTRVMVRIQGSGDNLPGRVQAAVAEDLGVDRSQVMVTGAGGGGS